MPLNSILHQRVTLLSSRQVQLPSWHQSSKRKNTLVPGSCVVKSIAMGSASQRRTCPVVRFGWQNKFGHRHLPGRCVFHRLPVTLHSLVLFFLESGELDLWSFQLPVFHFCLVSVLFMLLLNIHSTFSSRWQLNFQKFYTLCGLSLIEASQYQFLETDVLHITLH